MNQKAYLEDSQNNFLSTLILENILHNMPGHVYWKDINGVYKGCNDKQAKTLGLQFGYQVIGKTDFDLPWPENSAREFHENDLRIMHCGVAEAIEEKINDQGSFVFSIKSPIINDKSQIYGILGISIDITDKKRAQQLEKEKEIAQKNSEIMNILSSSIAHEIRTPLAIIKINADLIGMSDIAQYIEQEEEKKTFIDQMDNIQQAIKECSQVMNMLLVKLKRISMGKLEITDDEICSISRTVTTALSEYPFRKNECEKIHYNLNSFDFAYRGNARLTKHVLFNLIKNALHVINQTPDGEIYIESKSANQFNQLIFRDTGFGISPEYLQKIFNKFETTDDVHSGTGLGLAFCKLVMESYGGKIECRSELDKFTEFTLLFPVIDITSQ
jgi:two-component system, OmpR family, aerobic respiration control sensor histidine kinase ArcB